MTHCVYSLIILPVKQLIPGLLGLMSQSQTFAIVMMDESLWLRETKVWKCNY